MRTNKFFMMALALCSLAFISCGDDEESGNENNKTFNDVTLTTGQTHIIKNGDNITWTSGNTYIASVKNQVVTANLVGTTEISGGSYKFNVTVKPQYDYITTPYHTFGTTMSKVKSAMNGYTLYNSSSTVLLYNGKKYEKYIGYVFENSKLNFAATYVPTTYSDECAEFLAERYVYVSYDEDSNYMAFVSPGMDMIVALTVGQLGGTYYYLIAYMEYTGSNSRSTAELKTVFDQLNSKIDKGNIDTATSSELLEAIKGNFNVK